MRIEISECCGQSDAKAAGPGVVENVKVCGLVSSNGRKYLGEALDRAVPLYEGKVVNLNHPAEAGKSRNVLDRFGRLSGVRRKPDGIYADRLTYNPKHPFAEAFEWWVANDPAAVGLSHNAVGDGREEKDGTFVVTDITEVASVDLVADPATVKGLFESMNDKPQPPAGEPEVGSPDWKTHIASAIAAIVTDPAIDGAGKLAKIKTLLKIQDDKPKEAEKPEAEGKKPDDKKPDDKKPDDKKTDDEKPKDKKPMTDAKILATTAFNLFTEAKVTAVPALLEAVVEKLAAGDDAGAKSLVEAFASVAARPGVEEPRSAAPSQKPLTESLRPAADIAAQLRG